MSTSTTAHGKALATWLARAAVVILLLALSAPLYVTVNLSISHPAWLDLLAVIAYGFTAYGVWAAVTRLTNRRPGTSHPTEEK